MLLAQGHLHETTDGRRASRRIRNLRRNPVWWNAPVLRNIVRLSLLSSCLLVTLLVSPAWAKRPAPRTTTTTTTGTTTTTTTVPTTTTAPPTTTTTLPPG